MKNLVEKLVENLFNNQLSSIPSGTEWEYSEFFSKNADSDRESKYYVNKNNSKILLCKIYDCYDSMGWIVSMFNEEGAEHMFTLTDLEEDEAEVLLNLIINH